jgi:hypothetical protein
MTGRRGRELTGTGQPGNLDDADVERRLGGAAHLSVAPVRMARVGLRTQITRDTATILATALVTLLAWQLLAGGAAGPGASGSPPGDSAGGIGSLEGIPTLPPVDTLGPIVNPSVNLDATPTPVPFETAGPTTLTVFVKVSNGDGGNDRPSDWTVTVTGARPSRSTFAGSASGVRLVIDHGRTFSISTKAKTPGGYVESRSGNCSGPVPLGGSARCTITENDKPVALSVEVSISAGPDPSPPAAGDVTVSVTGSGVDQPSFPGSSGGTLVHFDANAAYSVEASPPPGYVMSASSACSSTTGLAEGSKAACTLTFTYSG